MADERRRLLVGGRGGDRRESVLLRQLVQVVLRARRLDEVRGDHRVVGRLHGQPRQRLEVVRDDLGVAEPRLELGPPLADDDALLGRDREAAVLDREPDPPAGQVLQGSFAPLDLRPLDAHWPGRKGRVQLVHAAEEVPELEAPEHLLELAAVGRREDERGRIAVDVEVAPHRRELLRDERLLRVLPDVLRPRGRELVHVLEHAVERAVLRDQLTRRLVPDPRNAGDVVGRVALEPDEVGDLVRPDPVARLDPLRRVDVDVRDPARRHHQADVVADELEGVAVGGDDGGLDAGLVGARGERGDHVVGLPALELEVAVAERLDDRPEVRELLPQEVGHRPPLGLVLLGQLRPVHGARVPRDCDALRPVVREQLEEHVREAEQRVRGEPLARRELLGEREEGAVGQVVAVDEEELGLARGRVVELELGSGEGLRHSLQL